MNFEFCTRMYTRSTMNGIEFVFNNQTVLNLLLLVKTVCGIDLLSYNKILWCMQIPLIVWSTGMKICLMGHLTDISWQSRSFLGFVFVLGFAFVTHDTIQCGMMCQRILLHSHMIHICAGLTNALSRGFT